MMINRRSFMKMLAVAPVFSALSKAEETPPQKPVEEPCSAQSVGHSHIFHNRKVFSAGCKRICWTKCGELNSWQVDGFIDLDTYDCFNSFYLSCGRLFWCGNYGEVWQIIYIGGCLVFVCEYDHIIKKEWKKCFFIETVKNGQAVQLHHIDENGDFWVEPIKDIYKT